MKRPSTVTIAESNRGRIPFALIGVVLLVMSSVAVVSLQTRPESRSDVGVATAFEQAETSTHAALRAAAMTGLRDAAAAPVTEASGTSLGNAIDAGIDSPDETFQNYARLRIYLAARERLARAEQYVGDGVTADASLPPIEGNADSIEAALDRVEMDAGSYTNGLETGLVDLTIENVTLTVEDGNGLEREQRTFNVTVPTTVFEMHNKTQEYEKRLDTGFFEPEFDGDKLYYGFGRKFAVRQYPVSWTKTSFDRFGSPKWDRAFEPIHDNRSTEILANLAVFDVQEATFGATDPAVDRVRRERMTCFALSTGYKMADAISGEVNVTSIVGSKIFNVSEGEMKNATEAVSQSPDPKIDEDTLCQATRYMMGDSDGELGDPPSVKDITEGFIKQKARDVDGSVEIKVDLFADASYYEILYGSTVDTLDDLNGEDVDAQWPPEESSDVDDERDNAIENAKSGGFDEDELGESTLDPDTTFTEVIDHVYDVEIDVSEDTERAGPRPWAPEPSGDDWREIDGERRYEVVGAGEPTITVDRGPETDIEGDTWSDLRDVTVTVENELKHVRKWSRSEGGGQSVRYETTTTTATRGVTFESEIDLDAKHSQDTQVDDFGIERVYESGGNIGPSGVPNFDRVPRNALGTVFGIDLDTEDALEAKLNHAIETESIVSEDDMRDETVSTTDAFEPDALTQEESERLESWAENESDEIREAVKDRVPPVEAGMTAFVDDDPILPGLRASINANRTEMVYGEGEPYMNPKEKVRAEAVKVYLDNIVDWTNRFDDMAIDTKNQAKDSIFGPLDGIDGKISNVVEFAQDVMADDVNMNSDADFDGSPLYDDVNYTIDASPTYLESSSVNRTELPAARASGAGFTELDDDIEHGSMVTKYDNLILPRPGLSLIPWPGFVYAMLSTWNLHVEGEYARFEVRADVSDPSTSEPVRYIRDDRNVTVELDDGEITAGSVTPVDFTSDTVVAVIAPSYTKVPRGKPGIGDPTDGGLHYGCDGPYPEVGPEPDEESCDWIRD